MNIEEAVKRIGELEAELERVQKQAAAMQDKAQSQLDAMAAVVKSAYVHKDQVKPLVDALRHIANQCQATCTSFEAQSAANTISAINAIAHAKSIGL